MGELFTDNRFEVIKRAKRALLDSTNINESPDEMKVLDNFLFRCWQMDWLAAYEDTGLTPEAIMEMKKTEWIPCSKRLPDAEKEVLVQANRDGDIVTTTAIYEDGKMSTEESIWNWYDVEFEYSEEKKDTYLIPEGWWEYRHYNPDDVYNCVIDDIVIAWQPLPETWKGEQE